jgi:hypothetical protein
MQGPCHFKVDLLVNTDRLSRDINFIIDRLVNKRLLSPEKYLSSSLGAYLISRSTVSWFMKSVCAKSIWNVQNLSHWNGQHLSQCTTSSSVWTVGALRNRTIKVVVPLASVQRITFKKSERIKIVQKSYYIRCHTTRECTKNYFQVCSRKEIKFPKNFKCKTYQNFNSHTLPLVHTAYVGLQTPAKN